ncbi:MAG TPA: VOC family protein [Crocinitomicaceae bacterium]|nr:VOC family protein [Crocinitomicaceae bacterium]
MKTQKIYLEHANITVKNLQRSIHFFQTAFPHFKIRTKGNETREWVHLGDDNTYIAINQFDGENILERENYDDLGINHIGFVVEDVDLIAKQLLDTGYKRDYPRQEEKFRTREYFADDDGNEFEFVQYLSDKIEERNYND